MATQNPPEQDGTYALPEAQLDRFALHVSVDYPAADVEHRILQLGIEQARAKTTAGDDGPKAAPALHPDDLIVLWSRDRHGN